jgi:anaerobic selenocysteine-containing dehydrogenase
LEDGRVVRALPQEGNINAFLSVRQVRACRRIRAISEYVYHPDRLKFPLKRMGERGEGKWETISWDQALDEIAEKLGRIKDEYGPEAIAVTTGTGRTHTEYLRRFTNLLGTPNSIGAGNICWGEDIMVEQAIAGAASLPIFLGSRCVVAWGGGVPMYYPQFWLNALDCRRELGAKLIVIDPRGTDATRRADIWLQPRPNTDAALALAWLNVVIGEELYDKEFVEKWCYGFDKLSERVKEYSPEKVAEITWVPADKIRAAARMYATNSPAGIQRGMGVEHSPTGPQTLRCLNSLAAITGNLQLMSGQGPLILTGKGWIDYTETDLSRTFPSEEQKRKQIGADRFKLCNYVGYEAIRPHVEKVHGEMLHGTQWTNYAHAPSVYRAVLTGKPYPVRAMFSVCSNPMITQANVKLVYKALKALDLYFVMDFWMTPSAELADYVLPIAAWFERPVEGGTGPPVFAAAIPARVEGQYDRRTDYDVFRGLGIRLGQEEYWPWETLEEAYNYRLAPMGIKVGDPSIMQIRPDQAYTEEQFGTPTGKFELYSTIFEQLGYDPLPYYEEPPESPISNPELAKEYPFILITGGRHNPFYHSEHRQIDSLRKQHPEPLVQIHPQTAAELEIQDGDWVWIETLRGRVRQKCRIFDGMDPRVVHAQHGWWFPELPGEEPWLHGVWESNINVVTDDDPEHCEKTAGCWPLRSGLCKIYKAKQY